MSGVRPRPGAGAALVHCRTYERFYSKDIHGPLVVFVHGFTADASYMDVLASYAAGEGMTTAVFNYPSFNGFDRGADALLIHLTRLRLPDEGFVLVGHSMGGLVARRLIASCSATILESLRGLVLLGTPNAGTFPDQMVLEWLLQLAEKRAGGFDPSTSNLACRSAQQLIRADAEQAIDRLNLDWQRNMPQIPVLSISGGKSRLGGVLGVVVRGLPEPHDGLVAEESADITNFFQSVLYEHWKGYPSYEATNHSDLVSNDEIAGHVAWWIRSRCFEARINKIPVAPSSAGAILSREERVGATEPAP